MTIQDIINDITLNKARYGIKLDEPAIELQIKELENALKIRLPNDIKEFYKFSDGFESNEDIFRIIKLDEIIQYADELPQNHFYLAEYMIYSDMWVVKLNQDNSAYEILEYSFKTVLTKSFTEFLERFLKGGVFDKGGLYDWKDEIDKAG